MKLPLRNCSSANVASITETRSSRAVLAAVIVARPVTACAGGKKNENVMVSGTCKIANFTPGRSVNGNYPQLTLHCLGGSV
jgi:hypothetical protein